MNISFEPQRIGTYNTVTLGLSEFLNNSWIIRANMLADALEMTQVNALEYVIAHAFPEGKTCKVLDQSVVSFGSSASGVPLVLPESVVRNYKFNGEYAITAELIQEQSDNPTVKWLGLLRGEARTVLDLLSGDSLEIYTQGDTRLVQPSNIDPFIRDIIGRFAACYGLENPELDLTVHAIKKKLRHFRKE